LAIEEAGGKMQIIENNFNIADLLLCDNYTIRGKDAMSRLKTAFPSYEDRLHSIGDIYCKFYEDENFADYTDDTNDETRNDFAHLTYASRRKTNWLEKKKKFETSFQTSEAHKILHIRGAAGSGKSSYLNYLKEKYREAFNKIIEVNLEYAPAKVVKGDKTFIPPVAGGVARATWLFVNMLLDAGFDQIWEQINATDTQIKIKEDFEACFGDDYPESYDGLFGALTNVLVCRQEGHSGNKRQLKAGLFSAMLEFVDRESHTDTIQSLLEVITWVLHCLQPGGKINLICIDGIEYYTGDTRIYDSDISDIAEGIYNFFETGRTAGGKGGEYSFENSVKVLMVVRDTTDKMFPKTVRGYFNHNAEGSVNITQWFHMDAICRKKIGEFERIFYEHIFKGEPQILDALKSKINFMKKILQGNESESSTKRNALGDNGKSSTRASLNKLLSKMYNHNKRRKARILSSVINHLAELTRDEKTLMSLDDFKAWWEEPQGTDQYVSQYVYLRRRAILRLIWDIIKDTEYLDCIGEGKLSNDHYVPKNTYARRILNYLFSVSLGEEDAYTGFFELLSGVFNPLRKNNKNINNGEYLDFSEILLALNESRFAYEFGVQDGEGAKNPNRWDQLVVIKYNDKKLNGSLNRRRLASKLRSIWNGRHPPDDLDEYGVKITSAGRFFIDQVLVDFEFFASRYTDTAPFVFIRDYDKIKKVLEKVYSQVEKVTWWIKDREEELFESSAYKASHGYHYNYETIEDNVKYEEKYPLRLIRQHIRYLEHVTYIIEDCVEKGKGYLKIGNDKDLPSLIKGFISRYTTLHKSLVDCGYLDPNHGDRIF